MVQHPLRPPEAHRLAAKDRDPIWTCRRGSSGSYRPSRTALNGPFPLRYTGAALILREVLRHCFRLHMFRVAVHFRGHR